MTHKTIQFSMLKIIKYYTTQHIAIENKLTKDKEKLKLSLQDIIKQHNETKHNTEKKKMYFQTNCSHKKTVEPIIFTMALPFRQAMVVKPPCHTHSDLTNRQEQTCL